MRCLHCAHQRHETGVPGLVQVCADTDCLCGVPSCIRCGTRVRTAPDGDDWQRCPACGFRVRRDVV